MRKIFFPVVVIQSFYKYFGDVYKLIVDNYTLQDWSFFENSKISSLAVRFSVKLV